MDKANWFMSFSYLLIPTLVEPYIDAWINSLSKKFSGLHKYAWTCIKRFFFLQDLIAKLVFKRPEKPIDYLVKEMEELKRKGTQVQTEDKATWSWRLVELCWISTNNRYLKRRVKKLFFYILKRWSAKTLSFIFNFRLYFRESFQIFKDYFEKLEWIVKWKQYKWNTEALSEI